MQSKETLKTQRRSDEMYLLLEEQSLSGMTVKQFCHENRLSPAVFYYWQKKFRQTSTPPERSEGFTEIVLTDPSIGPAGQLFAEYKGIRFYQEPSVSFLKQLIS